MFRGRTILLLLRFSHRCNNLFACIVGQLSRKIKVKVYVSPAMRAHDLRFPEVVEIEKLEGVAVAEIFEVGDIPGQKRFQFCQGSAGLRRD